MDTTIVIIVSITLLAIFGSVYLEVRRQIKPRIKVYFPDGSTRASYKAREEANVTIHIQNRGRLGLPKPAAMNMCVLVYTPLTFSLKEFSWGTISDTNVKQASSGGIFGGMHYIGGEVPVILFHGEEEFVTVIMQMPERTGQYAIKIAVSSREGDLGIHELEVIVT